MFSDLKSTFEEQEKTKLEILKIYNDRQDEFNAVQDKIEDMYGKMSRADRQLKNALQKIGDADIEKYRVSKTHDKSSNRYNNTSTENLLLRFLPLLLTVHITTPILKSLRQV